VNARQAVLVLLIVAVAACSGGGNSSASSRAGKTLTVYAAASLKAAVAKAADEYAAGHPGATFTMSTDSSSALETKIEQGAPADVFLSADLTNPRKLVDLGLASGDVVNFARNSLIVIVPRDNPAGIRSPADLARTGVKVIAAGDTVPITAYASELAVNLGSKPGYPADFARRYSHNIVSKEDNVAAVVSKIELGEGDAAIVYASDAKASAKVSTVVVPAYANVDVTYGGVVIRASANGDAARAFLAWLTGPQGQSILASFGFRPGS
jgi:molybdate transport system substrate-binding protein